MNKIKIFQGGYDGFGHQLEGTLRLLSLHLNNKAEYQFHHKKKYEFEHKNFDKDILVNYIELALKNLSINFNQDKNTLNIIQGEYRSFDNIIKNDINYENNIYYFDGVGSGQKLPNNFEYYNDIKKSLSELRKAFVLNNNILPIPSYRDNEDNSFINICCHIRMGDAVGTRILDNNNLINLIKHFQKYNNKYRIIIHSDGNVDMLHNDNTYIKDSNTDVLQILSDFIHCDILIMNYSSLSIASHLLGDDKQVVICPDRAGPTFYHRILEKCIKCSDFNSDNF